MFSKANQKTLSSLKADIKYEEMCEVEEYIVLIKITL